MGRQTAEDLRIAWQEMPSRPHNCIRIYTSIYDYEVLRLSILSASLRYHACENKASPKASSALSNSTVFAFINKRPPGQVFQVNFRDVSKVWTYSHPKVDRICRFSKKNHHFHKQIDRIFGGKFMAPERSPKPTLQMVRFLLELIENDQIPFDIE